MNEPAIRTVFKKFHFPNDVAAIIAVETVTDFLKDSEAEFDRIIFNVFKDMDRNLYEKEFIS